MHGTAEYIQGRLFAMQDEGYRAFHSGLIPNIDPETVIGVRVPQLRKLARELLKTDCAAEFLQALPHRYYEENALHGILISQMRDFEETLCAVNAFLPYIDNWAVCDILRPKAFAKDTERLEGEIARWLESEHAYTVRFALEMLLCFYLGERFGEKYLRWAAEVRPEHYYVKMMAAWYFAEALAKQRQAALPYIERGLLDKWVHNKAIQKALESCRISGGDKAYLRTLKRK